jgi:hypothetical protein
MRSDFRRLLACVLTVVSLAASAARAQEPRAPKRPSGPVAGPVITLPPGQGESIADPAAQDAEARRAGALQKWEYCFFTTSTTQKDRWSPTIGVASVRYSAGGDIEQVEGRSEEEAALNAMNKLGEEGWELVAIRESFNLSDGYGNSSARYFFKRPK